MTIDYKTIKKAASNIWGSPDGKIVLDYLIRGYVDVPLMDESAIKQAHNIGMRDIVILMRDLGVSDGNE